MAKPTEPGAEPRSVTRGPRGCGRDRLTRTHRVRAACRRLRADGHRVVRLVRGATEGADDVRWDPDAGTIDAAGLEGVDAVVHLAGAGIGDKKWTPARKQLILESRTRGHGPARPHAGRAAAPTADAGLGVGGGVLRRPWGRDPRPRPRPPVDDFPAQVCVAWEAATAPAAEAGIRVVTIRTGIVLAAHGGALQRMLLPFKLGLGGRIGSGEQYMSWITLDDHVGAVLHLLSSAVGVGTGQPHRARADDQRGVHARARRRCCTVRRCSRRRCSR